MRPMQIGKAYFELVDYLGADRAFSSARQASPYSLEGMDIYSTVLYVSSLSPWRPNLYNLNFCYVNLLQITS